MGGTFCRDPEGWGPLPQDGGGFTPCFVDATFDTATLLLIVVGSFNITWLLRQSALPVPKRWNYWTKLVIVGALFLITAALIPLHLDSWARSAQDISFWSPLIISIGIIITFTIHFYEHERSRVASSTLLLYWLFFIIVNGIKLQTLAARKDFRENMTVIILLAVSEGLALAVFLLEWLVPIPRSEYVKLDGEDDDNRSPQEDSDIFSILTFSWLTPMMKAGYKKFLTEEDLWNVRKIDTTRYTESSFAAAWEKELAKKKPNLWVAMGRAYGGPYLEAALYKVVQDILNYSQPQLLRLLIAFVASYQPGNNPQPLSRGLLIGAIMFAASVVQTLTLHQYFQHSFETGMRIRSGLTAAIYKKSMRLSNEGRASKSTGDIVNLQAVDTQRLQEVTNYGQQVWSSPFQIVLCMVSLYNLLGVSMFAGIGVMILMIPVNGFIARMMKNLQRRQMKNKDARTRLMTEILNNMKSIKLYSWGGAFMKKLNYVRNDQELATLKKIGAAQSVSSFTWSTTPFLVSCMTFTIFVLTQDRPLSTEIVFPALTLFNLLTFPLSVLPMVITALVEASVAAGRIENFLAAEEIQQDAITREDAVLNHGEETVSVRNGVFTWNKGNEPALKNINFTTRKGELACVVGRVGMGKSSFLGSLIGDLNKLEGEVIIRGNTAYVAQQAWIMNATVRENIVFGHRFDPEFYQRTIRACALLEDFDALPDGDETEVGEKGISLSGGQKARVNLARAVYARADIYILDDPLSAVDQHVGRHLIDNVIGPNGLLAGKTRIMATNSIPVLMEADFIYLINKGEIVESGSYQEVMSAKGGIFNIIKFMKDTSKDDSNSDEATIVASGATTSQEISSEEDEVPELGSKTSVVKATGGRRFSTNTLRRASVASVGKNYRKPGDLESGKKTTQSKEFSEQGKVKWSVYGEYAKASNLGAVTVFLLTLIGAQVAQVAGSVWLKTWSEHNDREKGNTRTGLYIGIYFAFGFGSALLVMIQTLILWLLCAIKAARKMHERMAIAIFRSPMSFFDTTPAGRILNRFSSDIYRIDEVLARAFNMLFVNTARSLSTLVLVSVSTPPFVALIVPLAFLYIYIQRYYLRTSRELKRLDSVSRSPIYAHFQESLGGISTIRAYQQTARFERENEWRIDANLKACYPSINANRWLAIRLEFIGSVIILSAASFAAISVSSGSGLSPGWVGLAMSYALQITQSLNWIVRQTVEVEINIVAVERVLEYAALPSEAPDIIPSHRPSPAWPANGAVEFSNYSTRYRPGLDLVLKDVSLDIKPREKIGIVGRTGAGKSSLTLALFRIIEPASGNINIDDLDTSTIGLQDLRQRLAIIPQDASLFEGTVRDNLDPSHVHDDTELWSVLELSHLKEHVSNMEGQLEAKINEGGSNLSVGQRSLVSLARALLTPSNILVIDEATASVDVETDQMLQQTIRDRFKDRTILTIAHRLNTIIDSDRIIVLSGGKVAEFDTPAKLLENKDSLFYSLAKEAGLHEQ